MNKLIWKLLPRQHDTFVDVVWRKLDNGREESCLVTTEQFKKDLADGAELQDAEGNVIDGIAYLEELV
jgi:hypothetical protein